MRHSRGGTGSKAEGLQPRQEKERAVISVPQEGGGRGPGRSRAAPRGLRGLDPPRRGPGPLRAEQPHCRGRRGEDSRPPPAPPCLSTALPEPKAAAPGRRGRPGPPLTRHRAAAAAMSRPLRQPGRAAPHGRALPGPPPAPDAAGTEHRAHASPAAALGCSPRGRAPAPPGITARPLPAPAATAGTRREAAPPGRPAPPRRGARRPAQFCPGPAVAAPSAG